jgi:hypothetical protein
MILQENVMLEFPVLRLGSYDEIASVGKKGVNKFLQDYKMCVALLLNIQEFGVQI